MSAGQHGSYYKGCRAYRTYRKQLWGLDFPQKPRSDEAADHRAAPIERDITSGRLGGESGYCWQAEVVHQETADRYFSTYISENTQRSEDQVWMPPDRIVDFLARLLLCLCDRRQLEATNDNRKYH